MVGEGKKSAGRVRMKDIAEATGVSRVAVSLALGEGGGSARISPETRQRILDAAARMNYKPNLIAKQLVRGHSQVIGFILDSHSYFNWIDCMAAASAELNAQNYRMHVGLLHDDYATLCRQLDDFYGNGVDGIICASHTYLGFAEKIPQLFARFEHKVLIQEPAVRDGISYIAPDRRLGTRMLLDEIYSRHYRQAALVTLKPADCGIFPLIEEFCAFERTRGNAAAERFVYRETPQRPLESIEGADEVVEAVLKSGADAVILGDDIAAMWIVKALQLRGIAVPEEVGVVSHSHIAFSGAFTPTIAGLECHFDRVGSGAVEILLAQLQGRSEANSERRYVAPSFCPGGSLREK